MTEPTAAADMIGMTVADAVRDADLRVLLMAVFQISGDRRWLAPPFAPRRDVRLIADEGAGLPPEVADEIRAAAIALADRDPVIDDPGDALMVEMMRVCLGEPVPPEYAPMMREELGFTSRDVDPPGRLDPTLDALVVGAGASGIAMAVRLERLGVAYTVIERRDDLGGVWHDNRYPGCAVDTPNHAYSFSFAPPNRWSRFFAPQPEIEEYLRRTADDFAVTDRIEFHTTLLRADWSEHDRRWLVELQGPNGTEHRSYRFLITAIGQLNEPKQPEFDGIDDFEGVAFHSSNWPGDLDLTGKRVAIIGTGASAMQIAPAIAEEVGALTIVQRSPHWARPIERYHDPIPAGSQWLFEHLPCYAPWFRFAMFWRYGDGLLPFLRKDDGWPHPERAVNRGNDRHRIETTDHIIAELGDRTDLIEKCVPAYPVFGKRILLDNGWYRMLRRPNVELVTNGVARITADGFVTDDARPHRADVIVFATGFEVTQMAARLHLTGRDGRALSDAWADENPAAYLGISVPGFPNLFCLQGPNTGLAHGGSAIFQSECQARHITGCIAALATAGATSIEAKPAAQDEWVAAVDAEHERLIWTHPGMSTYYRNRHGRIVSVMPWRLVDYWAMTHDPDLEAYEMR
jgi:4-hydroxyacetophenone monooxygenase